MQVYMILQDKINLKESGGGSSAKPLPGVDSLTFSNHGLSSQVLVLSEVPLKPERQFGKFVLRYTWACLIGLGPQEFPVRGKRKEPEEARQRRDWYNEK